ncbi:MAG: ABC transporter ATP-binding protein [Gammaproteobacteria bacterium]
MPSILVSFTGIKERRGALGVIQPGLGLRYLQWVGSNRLVRTGTVRGMDAVDGNLYAVTQASLRIYNVGDNTGADVPVLTLEREVVRKDWIVGGHEQAGLCAVAVAKARKRVYLVNTRDCAIEEFGLDGEFLGRRYLWELAPDVFRLPSGVGKAFTFGAIRGITRAMNDRIWLTVAECNNSGRGVVLDADSGAVVLNDLQDPCAGTCDTQRYYLLDAGALRLNAHAADWETGALSPSVAWSAELFPSDAQHAPAPPRFRGIAVCGDTVYCGIGDYADVGDGDQRQVPFRIAGFDAQSGERRGEFAMPILARYPRMKVCTLAGFPGEVELAPGEGLTLFESGRRVPAEVLASPRTPDAGAATETKPIVNVRPIGIALHGVSLSYHRSARSWFSRTQRLREAKDYRAIHDVSFSVREGEVLGVIGGNGSGKSTLCMLLAGTLAPDQGRIMTKGRVQLVGLGVGFQVELTGRDNVLLNGTLLGMSRRQVAEKMDAIVSFAELGDFIDEPLRTYSSGMRSRLAFAVATAVEPEILILDEVMATGDQSFSNKALARLESMRSAAKTVIMVSHNLSQVRKICLRVIWLEKGQVLMDGEPQAVIAGYTEFSLNKEQWLQRHHDTRAPVSNTG